MKKSFYVIAALVLAAGLAGTVLYNTAAGQNWLFERAVTTAFGQQPAPVENLRVVVCGSASPLGNDPERAQACIAVITPEHFFLFDTGARSPLRIAQARLPLGRLDAVFLTHFHSDHIAALPDVNLNSWVQGRSSSLEVHGPAGVTTVVEGLNQAYRLDQGYRVAHHGSDLLPPAAGPMTPVEFEPGGVVWQDELLTVTAFAVNHSPVEPAVGYRIDYRDRSAVISGDTVAVESLFEAAAGADLLLHDALSRTLLDPMIRAATDLGVPALPQIMTDVIDYHADSRNLEDAAAAAGVGLLVYYHLVPVPANGLTERLFRRGLVSDTLLARDLQSFDLPAGSTEIIVHEP